MIGKPSSFDEYVTKGILANNRFGISEVNNLESIKSVYFIREEFSGIEEFIKSGNIEAIKKLPEEQSNTGEYLDIMIFKDQNQKNYIVTVYDSNELEQDPQIIQIYLL